MLVLDSSAFFSMDALPDEEHVCPPGVIRELEKYEDPRLALWGDMVRVSDCSKESLEKVEAAARRSGDLGRLSPVDMTVLASARIPPTDGIVTGMPQPRNESEASVRMEEENTEMAWKIRVRKTSGSTWRRNTRLLLSPTPIAATT